MHMNPTYDFRGQVAVVTGAGGGMGLATAQGFAAAGAAVVLADLDENAVVAAAAELTAVRINAVCPGTIETPMVADMIAKGELDVPSAVADQPIGRLGRGDEIAAAVLWLCSPGASLVVGVALPVDGGYTAR
jgi:NAD(P)-dependent dehydrogenase (short-subunit alcohol dehydrogenase family)